MGLNRFDVHTHLIPPFWAESLVSHGGDPSGWGAPRWSPEQLIGFMDEEQIAVSMLSLTAPGIGGWHGAEHVNMARKFNEYGASLVRQLPDRIGYFATLPLPDINAALFELARAYDELNVDGICLHSNYGGTYLGEPVMKPLWEELDRRSAVVFVHPTTPGGKVLDGLPGPIEDYPADTTRAALQLVTEGHMNRLENLKIILSHGGGFLPNAATRFAELKGSLSPDASAASLFEAMQRFYFDTVLVGPSGLPSLLAFAPPDRIVFGTDYPYASDAVCKTFNRNLDGYPDLPAGKLEEINTGARALIPRFADVK